MLLLRRLRKKQGLSQQQLANMLGITQATLSGWENEKFEIDNESLRKCSRIFNVTVDYILGNDSPNCKGVKIPVLGKVQAGIPIEAIEEIADYEEISEDMATKGNYFGLVIRGDSMQPRILDGDVIIVRQQEDVDNGDVAVVLVNGNDATVKKIKKTEVGIQLNPYNPAFDIIFYTNDEIENLPVRIIGKVVELRGKL